MGSTPHLVDCTCRKNYGQVDLGGPSPRGCTVLAIIRQNTSSTISTTVIVTKYGGQMSPWQVASPDWTETWSSSFNTLFSEDLYSNIGLRITYSKSLCQFEIFRHVSTLTPPPIPIIFFLYLKTLTKTFFFFDISSLGQHMRTSTNIWGINFTTHSLEFQRKSNQNFFSSSDDSGSNSSGKS